MYPGRTRAAIRSAETRPFTDRIEKALHRMRISGRFLPRSSMGKAIAYALGQWQGLLLFLEDGRLEADNNEVETAIRPAAIEKKNPAKSRGGCLFIGDGAAGERSVILLARVENCRRIGIDPFEDRVDILIRLLTLINCRVKDITPIAWARARSAAAFLRGLLHDRPTRHPVPLFIVAPQRCIKRRHPPPGTWL